MNNTKELENEIVDFIMDNWGDNRTEVKINYLRLLVKNIMRKENEHKTFKIRR